MPEHESPIEYSDDKIRKSSYHQHRKRDIDVGVYWSIVSEHDTHIGKVPPDRKRQKNKNDICDKESGIPKWFNKIVVHRVIIHDVRATHGLALL